jgi:hypothetical protein
MVFLLGKNKDEPPVFQVPPPNIAAEMVVEGEMKKQMMYDNVNAPQMMDEAWMKYIIEFHLPKDLEQLVIMYLKPLIDLAPKSNIKRREIFTYLVGYDLIWDTYFIYMKKGKYDPKLLVVKEILRTAIELQLNRSVDGWLGRMMHTKLFRIFTNDGQGNMQKAGRFFGRSKRQQNNQEMM